MPGEPAVLSIENLSVALPEGGDREFAVRGITLDVKPGETVCLVGESGSGKTVAAQSTIGMLPKALPVVAGRVCFESKSLPPQRSKAFDSLRGIKMAMIFQDAVASLDPVQRIGRQLEEILAVHGVDRRSRKKRVLDSLETARLPDPPRIYRSYPHQLSGGQAQRVVIAGSLLLNPRLLIADEPTTALDVTTQAEILDLLKDLKRERKASVLFITHDFGVVAEIADRIAVMKEGEIVETGSADAVLGAPEHPYTRRLLAAARKRDPAREASPAKRVLEVRNLSLDYKIGRLLSKKHIHAVKGVSLQLEEGRTLAIVGESGSGKSSLARCILRLVDASAGTIRFKGDDITEEKGSKLRALRKRIQFVQQDPYSAINPRQTVLSAIAEGPIIHDATKRDAEARATELLEVTGLSVNAGSRYPHEFSGGQLQRICIARALALEPELLVADEPVSALDVSIQAQILDLFRSLQSKFGFAMVFITHDLRVAQSISDDILVMKDGEVVESGAAAKVFSAPSHPYTKALLAAAPDIALRRRAAA
ncbi:MAG: ABC transporter ATP-binding protein [Albidovulum sp.]|nr:ABC transporter ATP-binding protein [Albidovulum sp.]